MVNPSPQKKICPYLESVTLFGKRVYFFVDVIKLRILRRDQTWLFGWALNLMTSILYYKRHTEKTQGEEEDARWRERQRLELFSHKLENCRGHHKLEEANIWFSPRASRGSTALLTPWLWTSGLQNCVRINFCCFNLPDCDNLFLQSQEMNTPIFPFPSTIFFLRDEYMGNWRAKERW